MILAQNFKHMYQRKKYVFEIWHQNVVLLAHDSGTKFQTYVSEEEIGNFRTIFEDSQMISDTQRIDQSKKSDFGTFT
jgi:hypothetical protein